MSPARYNILMVFIGVVMAAFLFLRPDPAPTPQWQPLQVIAAEAVTHIQIDRALHEPVTLQRDGDNWVLNGVHAGPASARKADALANFTQVAPAEPLSFSEPPNLVQFGLDPPRAILSLNDLRFVFGETNPVDGRRYLFFQDRIYLVSEAIFHHLLSPAAAFASHALTEQADSVLRIDLPDQQLQRTPAGWVDETGADASAQAQWWLQAQALTVRKADEAQGSGETVNLHFESGSPKTFDIVAREPALKLRDRDRGIRFEFTRADVAGFAEP